GSLALLSEASHSGMDAGATLLTFAAIRIASRPPDADHQFGHGKAESLSAFLETLLLLGLSVFIAVRAVRELAGGSPDPEATWYSFAVMLLSLTVEWNRSRMLRRAARRYRSPALEADALHFTTDLLTSIAVLIGLGFVRLGYPEADAITSLLIAGYVATASIRIGRRSMDSLMDRAPLGATERVERAARSVDGVEEVRRVRLRSIGGRLQADVVVAIARSLPLEIAHDLTEVVEGAVRAVEPGADVVVHVEPLANETVISQAVLSIAARDLRVHQVHNVFAATTPEGLHITLHAKFPGAMSLAEAHRIAEELEGAIAREIPGVARVDTHLEPLDVPSADAADATEGHAELVAAAREVAEREPEVEDCHEVVVTDSEGLLSLVMHCNAAPGLSVHAVHQAATRIETEVYQRWPKVERVTVHFEPQPP
ncbi:MAG: cation diffusion facilitator family transporter, partial [Actinomycetota bacterium]